MEHFCKWITLLASMLLLCSCGAGVPASGSSPAPASQPDAGAFQLSFITIGKGDAFLLSCPDGSHYLVDTGKDEDYQQIARTLRVKDIQTLDGIFLTHGHKDHIGGLDTLLGAFPTGEVLFSGRDDASYHELLPREIAARHEVPVTELQGGEVLDLGGVTARVWLPARVDYQNENNNSLVLRIEHGSNTFLLMGDAEREAELLLLNSGFPLEADLLKLGHHGEDDASTPAFLDRVGPSIALIAGNAEENPDSVNDTVTRALQERNIRAYYSEGDALALDFCSDGQAITVEPVEDVPLPCTLHLSFADVDRKHQRVTLRNEGDAPADLTGCLLVSQRGDEHFLFPAGTVLEPGQTLTVACRGEERPGDLVWEREAVWKKKRDTALLYDTNLNLLAEDRAE